MSSLATIGRFTLFVSAVARSSLTRKPPLIATIRQAYELGVRSLPILLVISGFVGTNLAIQGYSAFRPLGGQHLIGMFVALAGVREMVPIMVASLVAAKGGTEMASQLAVMRIREEIDALDVMAVSPHWILVTPRFLGMVLVLPPLTLVSIFAMLSSAWAVSVFQLGLSGPEFIRLASTTTEVSDLLTCSLKAAVFGVIICLVSCYCGFHSKAGPRGVGSATNAAVVVSAVVCVVVNYLISEMFYG